jgi:hypothetical protein
MIKLNYIINHYYIYFGLNTINYIYKYRIKQYKTFLLSKIIIIL